jgi:hypothetical protein
VAQFERAPSFADQVTPPLPQWIEAQLPSGVRDAVLRRAIDDLARLRLDVTIVRSEADVLHEQVPEPIADAVLDVVARASWS